jgi:DNA polymerase-3 subunit epsilon
VAALFAVVDVETTGLYPGRHDRVVEIGVVVLDEKCAVVDEWGTLVNPSRDVGPTSIHGIAARHVANAPTFVDIAGDLLDRLCSQVLVAHNAYFDLGFLKAEFTAAGVPLPPLTAICTMELANASGLTGSRRLIDCYDEIGIDHTTAHCALYDARAAAALLAAAAERVVIEVSATAFFPSREEFGAWPSSGMQLNREAALSWRPPSYLTSIARRLPMMPAVVDANPQAVLAYADLLDRALEDRRITDNEADALCEVAQAWGLDAPHIEEIHRSYLTSLIAYALADAVLTDEERADLEWVGDLFGLDHDVVAELIAAATPAARSAVAPDHRGGTIVGQSVCFTGESQRRINGEALTRSTAELLAASAGLVVARSVTKKLDILVVADPDTMSGKARKAREYGTRIVAERAFWPSIGILVD